jgi:hypothetical protein
MAGKECTDDELLSAKHRVVEARRIVERQRQLIDALRANGRSTEDEERTLDAFLQSLTILEGYLRSLSKSVQ